MENNVGHEDTEPNHGSSGPAPQQSRRRRRNSDANQSNQRRRHQIDQTSVVDRDNNNNNSSGSRVDEELLGQQGYYRLVDGQREEDALSESANDVTEEERSSSTGTEGLNTILNQENQNQDGTVTIATLFDGQIFLANSELGAQPNHGSSSSAPQQRRRRQREPDANQPHKRRRMDRQMEADAPRERPASTETETEGLNTNSQERSSRMMISVTRFRVQIIPVDNEGAQPNQGFSSSASQQNSRRQRELDANRRGIDETSVIDEDGNNNNNNNSSSGPSVNDDETVAHTESLNTNSQDNLNQEGSTARLLRRFGFLIPVENHIIFSADARLTNIEGMSYEELMALQEMIGKAESRLSKETISGCMKTRVYTTTTAADSAEEKTEICIICQDEYEDKDKIGTLDCQHEYHEDCITQWLVLKNVCPICKRQGLKTSEENKVEVDGC